MNNLYSFICGRSLDNKAEGQRKCFAIYIVFMLNLAVEIKTKAYVYKTSYLVLNITYYTFKDNSFLKC